ncbi:MAG: type II toxin-antitoxin system HipA family toxin [Xanthomonadaceae bacterium]|nr:type II toxin-antitoxin system HipA family toxin [Xanthomonadaceae bacterium]
MTEKLSLLMNSIPVGTLIRKSNGAISFEYASTWLEREYPIPISRQLPLQEKPFSDARVRTYFDNLLPDDLRVREKLAAQSKAGSAQVFDLLSALGRDCVGALQFYPETDDHEKPKAAYGTPISDTQIAKLIQNLRLNPLGIGNQPDFRISLAGAQNKTALLYHEGRWMLPGGVTPTTHILKPAIGKIPDGPDFSLSVENEWLCLEILRAYGLNVADTEIIDFKDTRALSIKRFDREWSGKKLLRIPQEDLCQALGVGPEKKYETDGGPGIGSILSLLNESNDRDRDRTDFMKTQLIFWIIAAIDSHAKNFSAFIQPHGFTMTPLYDVMSADPHVNAQTLPEEKLKLAMAVGDKRYYKIKEIQTRHWLQTAKKYKFSGMENIISEVTHQTSQVIESSIRKLPKGFPKKVSEPIFKMMLKRVKLLET